MSEYYSTSLSECIIVVHSHMECTLNYFIWDLHCSKERVRKILYHWMLEY
jgi:hypothetical protein